jgi:hypothetical protein
MVSVAMNLHAHSNIGTRIAPYVVGNSRDQGAEIVSTDIERLESKVSTVCPTLHPVERIYNTPISEEMGRIASSIMRTAQPAYPKTRTAANWGPFHDDELHPLSRSATDSRCGSCRQRDELAAVGIRQISRNLRSRVSAIGAAKAGVNSLKLAKTPRNRH